MKRVFCPLVDGERAAAVRAQVARLAETIAVPEGEPRADLAGGDPGPALVFAELGDHDRARDFLRRAGEDVGARLKRFSLFDGWLGLAWTARHLLGDELAADPLPRLARAVQASGLKAHYDLSFGLAGCALVALGEPGGGPVVASIVSALAEQALVDGPRVTWRTAPWAVPPYARERHPTGHFNVGLAHGVPGLLAVLAQCGAVELARGAAAWLLAKEQPASAGSAFGVHFEPGDPPVRARLAWCYGDPGVAAALATAALALDDEALLGEAARVGRLAAGRADDQSGVRDASLCHGSGGLALIFQRLWQATGDDVFAAAARRWLDDTMRRLRAGEVPAERGFLTGRAGVALALLAAITTEEPSWDAVLLTRLAR